MKNIEDLLSAAEKALEIRKDEEVKLEMRRAIKLQKLIKKILDFDAPTRI
jgi:hypothetical protein